MAELVLDDEQNPRLWRFEPVGGRGVQSMRRAFAPMVRDWLRETGAVLGLHATDRGDNTVCVVVCGSAADVLLFKMRWLS